MHPHNLDEGNQSNPRSKTLTSNMVFWFVYGVFLLLAAFDVTLLIGDLRNHRLELLTITPVVLTCIRWLLIVLSPFVSRGLGLIMLGIYFFLFLDSLIKGLRS